MRCSHAVPPSVRFHLGLTVISCQELARFDAISRQGAEENEDGSRLPFPPAAFSVR